MATSSKRFLVLVIILDILLGLILTFSLSGDNLDTTDMNNNIDSLNNWSNSFGGRFGNVTPDTSTINLDKSFGDVKFGGSMIFNILKNGVGNPISEDMTCSAFGCIPIVYKWLVMGLLLVLGILHVLAFVEIYYIIVNRKVD